MLEQAQGQEEGIEGRVTLWRAADWQGDVDGERVRSDLFFFFLSPNTKQILMKVLLIHGSCPVQPRLNPSLI